MRVILRCLAVLAVVTTGCTPATSGRHQALPPVPIAGNTWEDEQGLIYSLTVEVFYLAPQEAGIGGEVHVFNPSVMTRQIEFAAPEPVELRVYDSAGHILVSGSTTMELPGGVLRLSPSGEEVLSYKLVVRDKQALRYKVLVPGSKPSHSKLGTYTIAATLDRAEEAWFSTTVDTEMLEEGIEGRCPGLHVPGWWMKALEPTP